VEAKPPYYSVFCISAAALAYEILLIRLFSIIQWHHYAQLIISLALLGYGVSGTFLSFIAAKPWLNRSWFYMSNLVLFSLSAVICFLLAQNLAFSPEELIWDNWQPFLLLTLYLVLSIPFFFAANAIGITFVLHGERAPHIYAADLLGASLGSVLILIILWSTFPNQALYLISALGLCALLIAMLELSVEWPAKLLVLTAISACVLLMNYSSIPLVMSPYKDLTQTLRISDAKIISKHTSPLGLIQVVENNVVPFRHAPGLSMLANSLPPKQLAMFIDGGSMTAIDQHTPKIDNNAYLAHISSALPYHLGENKRALIVGVGGGSAILQAQHHKLNTVDAVESNNQIIDLLKNEFMQFNGNAFNQQNIHFYNDEIRGYISQPHLPYDVIQISALNSFGASSAGLYALSEGYNFTIEAFSDYLNLLSPNGKLAITLWNELPPKKTLKLVATAIAALKNSGETPAQNHLALIRNWQTSTLIVKKSPISNVDINAIKQFCKLGLFDTAYYPGMPTHETNRYNILHQAYYYDAVKALLSDNSNAFIKNYKYNIQPATDDKPFADHFFKWSAFPELLDLLGKGGMPLIQWGYILLLFTLVQALILGIILIILPLWFKRFNSTPKKHSTLVANYLAYFVCLGLAFLFIEIVFIQKFILFLSYPVYSSAAVLLAFLLFAGLGSMASQSLLSRFGYNKVLNYAVFSIAILSLITIVTFDFIFTLLAAAPSPVKFGISVLIIAPLAYCMGMPFPIGLKRLKEVLPSLVPWIWGANGFASVLSAILASILAIHFGFTSVIIFAICIYVIAAIIFTRKLCTANTL